MRRSIPTGTVTFLFTDIEGSTRLLHELGTEAYTAALLGHRRIIRAAIEPRGGIEMGTEGDSFFVAFPAASEAISAALEAQEALTHGAIRVRMGLHTGTAHVAEGDYVGVDVHKAARIASAGHGGQILLSGETRRLASVDVTDLGEHRLKDFDDPIEIFQAGSDPFPPLKTISNSNLPRPASSFVGREREVEEILSLLRGGARLLSLTGPGGSGKTRLAIEAAAELVSEFKAGVFWVGLAALRDPALVSATIGQMLGAKDGVASHVGERELLLVLDNLEQVAEAAPQLSALVETCPNLVLLVTSRELLRVRGEVEYSVFPLTDREAVQLFCSRSGADEEGTVNVLCRALDNLPLAIELAAGRAGVLSAGQILDRLSKHLDLLKGGRDADPRQQTLRATIEWSYELLAAEEKVLFARLAVFRGGSTLEAVEEVTDADLDALQSLVDKSLLRRTGERFWMLETIRAYATERLQALEDAEAIRRRHAMWFLAMAEHAYQQRRGGESVWFPIMDAERDNLRAALDWSAIGDVRLEAQLAGAVAFFWNLQGHTPEAHGRLTEAVARYRSPDRVRARVLTQLGGFGWFQSESDGLSALQEALGIWRDLLDVLGEAQALEGIGHISRDAETARLAFEQSLALRRLADAPPLEGAGALAGLCQLLVSIGDHSHAEPAARELYELGERHGSRDTQGDALHYLADCPLLAGDYPEAVVRYAQALAFARESGIPNQCANELLGMAMAISGQGEHARAVRLSAAAYAKKEALGLPHRIQDHFWTHLQERFIDGARSRLTPEELDEAERAGQEAAFEAILDEVLGP